MTYFKGFKTVSYYSGVGVEAKSILVKTYFREKEKEKVNKLLLVTVTCGDGVKFEFWQLTASFWLQTVWISSTKYDAFTVIIYVQWKRNTF